MVIYVQSNTLSEASQDPAEPRVSPRPDALPAVPIRAIGAEEGPEGRRRVLVGYGLVSLVLSVQLVWLAALAYALSMIVR